MADIYKDLREAERSLFRMGDVGRSLIGRNLQAASLKWIASANTKRGVHTCIVFYPLTKCSPRAADEVHG